MSTDQQRYDKALAYLKTVNPALGNDVAAKTAGKTAAVGAELSLGGAGYWRTGTDQQHIAVRALLLCHIVYFRTPQAAQDYAVTTRLHDIRAAFLGKPESQVKAEILYFTKATAPALEALATAAVRVCSLTGVVDHFIRTRNDINVSPKPVCYHGVVSWLFAAGFVSKRWLAKEGNQMTAYSCNANLGDGAVVDPANWHTIPRGYLWNIHRVGDKTTCHWGLSLGNNVAAACNNTDESPTKKLDYEFGDTFYGRFKFRDICDVLNGTDKYGHSGTGAPTTTNIVVRQVNPLTVAGYY